MENLLEFDLNDLVSKQVMEKIERLEKDIKLWREKSAKQRTEIDLLKKQAVDSTLSLELLDYLRKEFAKIQKSEQDSSGYYDSKEKNQFLFIEKILLNIFNIKKEATGWLCKRNDGSLFVHLSVNYYNHKDVVVNLLKVLIPEYDHGIQFISSFKMPFEYPKKDVIQYVKEPPYNTNGCIFGISNFWVERGAGKGNMPHDLIMKNPAILEDDVFELLINSIKKKISEYHYLFALPKYNKNISKEQLERLGECLTEVDVNVLSYDTVNEFISDNLVNFNTKTLDFLYARIQYDNHYKTLHWEKFPAEYQMKFLLGKTLDEILKIITGYSCKWTIEQKQEFLKEFVNQ